jgi:hypothetical protein
MIPALTLRDAEAEFWEAVEYYESHCRGLGLDFAAEIDVGVKTISASPERWPLRDDGTRRYLTHRFPYLIVYVYSNRSLWIVAFAHTKRTPGYWANRLAEVQPPQ